MTARVRRLLHRVRPHRVAPALACLALITAGAGTALAAEASAAPLRYVALGDSYSAASGVLPLDPQAPLPCLCSSRNFAHVIAEQTGAQLADVTCGAAETKDFFTSQHPGIARSSTRWPTPRSW